MTKWTAAALDAPHTQRHLDAIPQAPVSRPKPIVMSKPKCPQCDMTKRKFDQLGIEFDAVDLTQDESAMAVAQSLGHKSAPVVIWGNDHWSGFRPDLIQRIAAE